MVLTSVGDRGENRGLGRKGACEALGERSRKPAYSSEDRSGTITRQRRSLDKGGFAESKDVICFEHVSRTVGPARGTDGNVEKASVKETVCRVLLSEHYLSSFRIVSSSTRAAKGPPGARVRGNVSIGNRGFREWKRTHEVRVTTNHFSIAQNGRCIHLLWRPVGVRSIWLSPSAPLIRPLPWRQGCDRAARTSPKVNDAWRPSADAVPVRVARPFLLFLISQHSRCRS